MYEDNTIAIVTKMNSFEMSREEMNGEYKVYEGCSQIPLIISPILYVLDAANYYHQA